MYVLLVQTNLTLLFYVTGDYFEAETYGFKYYVLSTETY